MALDFKKLRVFNKLESCQMACMRSPIRREPVQLKNGRWAAMTFGEKFEYQSLRKTITSYKAKHDHEVAEIKKAIRERKTCKNQ